MTSDSAIAHLLSFAIGTTFATLLTFLIPQAFWAYVMTGLLTLSPWVYVAPTV
jgi:uncharacterized membrane protein YgaE (UPF0421/DUF939 family)